MHDEPTEEEIRAFECLDCSVNTMFIDEYYMVTNELWLQANPDDAGMLCIGCLEKRLDRRLKPDDFTNAPINYAPIWDRSTRLENRLRGA